MAEVLKVEGFPKRQPTDSSSFDLPPCHLRPAICTELPNPATNTSCRKRHHVGGHHRSSVKKRQ